MYAYIYIYIHENCVFIYEKASQETSEITYYYYYYFLTMCTFLTERYMLGQDANLKNIIQMWHDCLLTTLLSPNIFMASYVFTFPQLFLSLL